jgi:hypothetical protein
MPNSANSNSGSTGTTSPAAAARRFDEPAASEAEYLADQSAAARAAMLGVIGDFQANLRARWEQATDVHGWIDRHPWMAVGAASAAGFATAAAVTPSAGQSLRDKLSSTIEAAMAQVAPEDGQSEADEVPPARPSRASSQPSIWGMLLEPVMDVLKVAVQNYFAAYVAGQAAAHASCAPENDHSDRSDRPSSAESTETNASAMA